MNSNEIKFFTTQERLYPDVTALPTSYLLKALLVKLRRRLYGGRRDAAARLVWTVSTVSDADTVAANVRNYRDHTTIRSILAELTKSGKVRRACEIGCGYGRVIMVLKEFADDIVGFEREPHLVEAARVLLPDIRFQCVDSLAAIADTIPYDLVMTSTVLQHLSDADARQICDLMKRLAPSGLILCIEKTEEINITKNVDDGTRFISRARAVSVYEEYMHPYSLVMQRERVIEPTYGNARPGSCLLFASPRASRH